jgi:hypothetical protein
MVGYDLEMLRPTLTHVGMRSKQDTYTWQTGKVVDFDEDGKQHQIGFNSGQILWFNLHKKMFVLLPKKSEAAIEAVEVDHATGEVVDRATGANRVDDDDIFTDEEDEMNEGLEEGMEGQQEGV